MRLKYCVYARFFPKILWLTTNFSIVPVYRSLLLNFSLVYQLVKRKTDMYISAMTIQWQAHLSTKYHQYRTNKKNIFLCPISVSLIPVYCGLLQHLKLDANE